MKQILLIQLESIFVENNTYENGINIEHKLNTDTVMNLITIEKHFHYYSQKCLQSYNFGVEASKI